METTPDFVATLDSYLLQGAIFCVGLSVLIFLYHELRIILINDYKQKYDYVNQYEVRFFWYAVMPIILAFAFYLNHRAANWTSIFGSIATWFYIRTFLTLSFVVVTYYVTYSLINIYYPSYMERKLDRLRNKPRVSSSGNVMRKLKEAEEEAHLEAQQWNEQKEIHSVDYDVWLDEKTGEKKIEKYIAYKHATECPECGYVTLKISREELVRVPSETEAGLLIKHYRCSYCKHREAKEVAVAPLLENALA
jgi:hypothetical protein